jgi:hypothetical protein
MPDLIFVVVVGGFVFLVAYLLATQDRTRRDRRPLIEPPDQAITTRRFSPWGWWAGSEFVYRTSALIKPRGRRRVSRGVKPRGQPDRTLEGEDSFKRRD